MKSFTFTTSLVAAMALAFVVLCSCIQEVQGVIEVTPKRSLLKRATVATAGAGALVLATRPPPPENLVVACGNALQCCQQHFGMDRLCTGEEAHWLAEKQSVEKMDVILFGFVGVFGAMAAASQCCNVEFDMGGPGCRPGLVPILFVVFVLYMCLEANQEAYVNHHVPDSLRQYWNTHG